MVINMNEQEEPLLESAWQSRSLSVSRPDQRKQARDAEALGATMKNYAARPS